MFIDNFVLILGCSLGDPCPVVGQHGLEKKSYLDILNFKDYVLSGHLSMFSTHTLCLSRSFQGW